MYPEALQWCFSEVCISKHQVVALVPKVMQQSSDNVRYVRVSHLQAVSSKFCTTEALQIKGTASSTNPVRLLPLSKQYCSSSSIIHIVVYGMTQHKNSGRCLSAESAHHTLRYKYS